MYQYPLNVCLSVFRDFGLGWCGSFYLVACAPVVTLTSFVHMVNLPQIMPKYFLADPSIGYFEQRSRSDGNMEGFYAGPGPHGRGKTLLLLVYRG